MDRGKRQGKLALSNNKIYLDLKDVVREHALPFLPAKSLSRFQGVCRDWKLQISTPFFAHNQSVSCHSVLGLFCQADGAPPTLVPFDPASCGVPDASLGFIPVAVDIRSSSNGLLLCQAQSGDRAYYICNPASQQWKKIPKQNADHGSNPAAVLVFEPSLLNFEADYKIVCAFPSADFDDATEFEIYSSKEGSWRISGEICFATRYQLPGSGVHVNGVVYWIGKLGGLLAFDIAKDRSLLLQNYHSSYYSSGGSGALGSLNGSLCTATISGGRTIMLSALVNIHTNTMQMDSKSRMWQQKLSVTLDNEVASRDGSLKAVLFVGDNKVAVRGSQKSLYLYDIETKETKAFGESDSSYLRCVPYVNSLVSL